MKPKPPTFDLMLSFLAEQNTDEFFSEFFKLEDEIKKVSLLAYNNAVIFNALHSDQFENIITTYYDDVCFYRILNLYEYAQNIEFENFKQCLNSFSSSERIRVLCSSHTILLFQVAYQNFKIIDLLSLISDCLPAQISVEEQDDFLILLKHCRAFYPDDKNKAKLIIAEFLSRIPTALCCRQDIAFFSAFMLQEAFIPFISRQPTENLPVMYFSTIKSAEKTVHIFSCIQKHQGSNALCKLLDCFLPRYRESLTRELMKSVKSGEPLCQTLLSYQDSMDLQLHPNNLLQLKIIDLVNETLTDRIRSGLIVTLYENLSWPALNLLLQKIDHSPRLQLLLSPMPDKDQNTLVEKLASENPDVFMQVLNTFSNAEGKFLIFSTPIKYGQVPIYSNNLRLNTSVEAFTSIVSRIPAIGAEAKQSLESFQGAEEVSELLLLKMLQRNPSLISCLPDLLKGCSDRQLNILLKNQDSTKTNLYIYLARGNSAYAVIKILSYANYAVEDREKIFNPKTINFSEVRKSLQGAEDQSALTGFLGLITLYNYIAVRHQERVDADYQKSFSEFNMMLYVLLLNKYENEIKSKLQKHCDENPLRQAWSIPLATSVLQLSSQRHHDARENLLVLDSEELQKGITLFQQFIALRYNAKNEAATYEIDSHLMKTCFPENRSHSIVSSVC
jgi:hypothetical protein